MRLFKKIPKKLLLAAVVYIILFSVLSIIKYKLFLYSAYDLAIFNQALWNTLYGTPFWISVTFPHIYLYDHIDSWLALILPVYGLFQHPITLLVLQSFFLGISCIPLYFIAQYFWETQKIGTTRASAEQFSLGIAILWLLNPFIHNINLFEFHFLPFFSFFLFSAVYAYLKNNRLWYVIMFTFAVCNREDTGFVALGMVLLLIIDWFKNKNNRKNILFFIISSLAIISVWILVTYRTIAFFSELGGIKYVSHYSWMGSGVGQIIRTFILSPNITFQHILSMQNINVFVGMLMPFAFLPFFKPRWILLSAVPLVAVFLLDNTIDHTSVLHLHYMASIVPGFFIAFIESFISITKAKNKMYIKLTVLIVLIATIYTGIFFGPLWPKNLSAFTEIVQARTYTWKIATKLGKPKNYTLADEHYLPALASSKNLYAVAQIYRGEKEFTNLEYPFPCDVENVIMSNTKITQSVMFSSFYSNKYASLQNIQKVLDCSPIKYFYYDNALSIAYDTKEKTSPADIINEGTLKNIQIQTGKNELIITGNFELDPNINQNKIVLRAEIFDSKSKKGLAVVQAVQQPQWKKDTLTDKNSFNMRITSKRFLNMIKNNPEINLFLTENGGFTTAGWLNTAIEVIDKPHIIYAVGTMKL